MHPKQLTKNKIEQMIKECASTPQGQVLLFWLMHECGFDCNNMNPENPNVTQWLAAKRGVYAKLRKMLNTEDVIQVEHGYVLKPVERKATKNERRNTTS